MRLYITAQLAAAALGAQRMCGTACMCCTAWHVRHSMQVRHSMHVRHIGTASMACRVRVWVGMA